MAKKLLFAVLFLHLKGFLCAQTAFLPDSINLSNIRFFKNRLWHDSLFPEKSRPAMSTINAALSLAEKTNDAHLKVYGGIVMAQNLLGQKNYTGAFDMLNRTLILDTLLEPLSPVRQFLYVEASIFYNEFGTYKLAAKFLKKAIDINQRRDSLPTARLFGFYSNYAKLFERNGMSDSCGIYYQKAIETGRKVMPKWEASGLNNYGIMLFSQGKVNEAMLLFLNAREVFLKSNKADTSLYNSINDNIAEIYALRREYSAALPLFEAKFKYGLYKKFWRQVMDAGIRSANMMIKLSDFNGATQRIAQVDSTMQKNFGSLNFSRKESFARLKYEMACAKGLKDEALLLQEQMLLLKDSIITDAQNDKLGKLESILIENADRYANEIELEKLKSLENSARAKFNKTLAVGTIISGLLLVTVILLLYRRRIIVNRFALEQESVKRQLAENNLELTQKNLENEQLGKIRMKQQLELNQKMIEQESYQRELAEINLKNETLEKAYLSQQLELKKRDATDFALAYSHRKKILDEVMGSLKKIKKSVNPANELQQLTLSLKNQMQGEQDAKLKSGDIEKVNNEFFEKLLRLCPDLTHSEKDLTGLIRLNFSTKEISSLRSISPTSVRMSKFRLKKKLGLEKEQDLAEFIRTM